MKRATQLKVLQAELRSRPKWQTRSPVLAEFTPLQKQLAALVLHYRRGWSARKIAWHLKWKLEDVERFLDAGKPLL